MYIEKLSKRELKQLFVGLGAIVENGNRNVLNHCWENCKIIKGSNFIKIIFIDWAVDHYCVFTDFDVTWSYGYLSELKKIKTNYRKFMYKKFGNEYYNNMRDFYKRELVAKYDKELEQLSNDLNEMIK